MPDGRAYQGLPTSPVIANLAAIDMDKAILRLIEEKPITYTRYADDLTFSFDYWANYFLLLKEIPQIVSRCGFSINPAKTHFQDGRFGRRIITGVSVDNDLRIPRSFKRKMRAARHQNNFASLKGYEEWSKLKKPKNVPDYTQKNLDRLLKAFKISGINIADIPEKEEVNISDNCIITGDFAYMLGPSNFTTNWRSCLQHPNGSQRTSVVNWLYSPHVRIAALLSQETICIAGFNRRRMRARVYIYELSNDKLTYGIAYGESQAAKEELKELLRSQGIYYISNYSGQYIKGGIMKDKIRRMYNPGFTAEWHPGVYKFRIQYKL
jgi:hypothetical protein